MKAPDPGGVWTFVDGRAATPAMTHWIVSSTLGLLLTGRYIPVCAAVYGVPDCAARRAFLRLMDMAFHERNHCRRIWLTYRFARSIR